MPRVEAADVQAIIQTDASISDLTPFIIAANELVTELCTDSGYSDTRLEEIERWLAAHFYAIRDPRVQSEGAGGVSGTYQGQTSTGLKFTSYGQQAMLLDTAGALAQLSAQIEKVKPTVGVVWLGTDLEEADDEDDE